MDTVQWPQEIVVKPVEQIVVPIPEAETFGAPKPNINCSTDTGGADRKPRPQKDQALNCPRCNSTNTKFCYYNNYSLSQPRYFCKGCRRYWTEGGSLRNIPVGGGSRKNKGRPSSSSTSPPSTSASSSSAQMAMGNPQLLDPHHGILASKMRDIPSSSSVLVGQNPNKGQDLNLRSSSFELLNSKGLLGSLMSMPLSVPHHDPNGMYTPPPAPHGLYPGFLEMKPAGGSLGFSLDGLDGGGFRSALHDSASNIDDGGGRLLFPFQELKQTNDRLDHHEGRSADHHHQQQQQGSDHHQHHHPNGFWNGMFGGGSW